MEHQSPGIRIITSTLRVSVICFYACFPAVVQASGCLKNGESYDRLAVWTDPQPYKRFFPSVKSASVTTTIGWFDVSDKDCAAADIESRRQQAEKELGITIVLVPSQQDYSEIALTQEERLKLRALYPSVLWRGELENENTVVLVVRNESDLRTPDADDRKNKTEVLFGRPVTFRWIRSIQ